MPRDVVDAPDPVLEAASDAHAVLPDWAGKEKRLAHILPYVSLVTDTTIRTRGNELMQSIRLEGVNSTTSEDSHLDRIGALQVDLLRSARASRQPGVSVPLLQTMNCIAAGLGWTG